MTKHEAALMIGRILDDDYASLTDRAREALQMGIDILEEEEKRERDRERNGNAEKMR